MDLTRDNIKVMAARNYRVPKIDDKEFNSDLSLINRIVYRLDEFRETGDIQIKKVINNFLIACNCFGYKFVVAALFLKGKENLHPTIFSFLSGLGYDEEYVRVNSTLTVNLKKLPEDVGIKRRIEEAIGEF